MSFHKRWVRKELLISQYRSRGILGIQEFLGKSDAFICEDKLSEDVLDILGSDEMEDTKKWDLVSTLISDESIKLGFGEEKSSQ